MKTTASIDMLDHALPQDGKPALGLQGRIMSLNEFQTKAIKADTLLAEEQVFREASHAGSKINGGIGARLHEVKENIPDLKDSGGRAIARAIADDYKHLADAVKARGEGRYLEVKHEDGAKERGIISVHNGEQRREGMWIARDAEGHLRQIAGFQDGKPHGSVRNFREDGSMESSAYFKEGVQQGFAYKYNQESKAIHKEVYKDGKLESEGAVDPQQRDEQRAQMRAVNSIKVGR